MFPTIRNLEKKLLADSVVDDLISVPFEEEKNVKQDEYKILTAEQARYDISIFARTVINAYCGWPFYSNILKFKVLYKISKLYDSIKSDISVQDLFNKLAVIITLFPDNHIRIKLLNVSKSRDLFPKRTVGDNLAKTFSFNKKNKIAEIAIPELPKLSKEEKDELKIKTENILKDSNAVIIDLRGNLGGSSAFTDWLAYYLCGKRTPYCKKSYIRTTSEGKILHKNSHNSDWNKIEKLPDPAIWHDFTKTKLPEKWAYNKPVYVLIDRYVASSAELFISHLLHHPNLILIGDNTLGCEVYGWMGRISLKNSNILFFVGQVYRDMEKKNFELNGYTPDIKCIGRDAYAVALSEIAKNIKCDIVKSNENIK